MTKLHFSLFVIIGILSIPIQQTYANTQKTYSCKACPPGTISKYSRPIIFSPYSDRRPIIFSPYSDRRPIIFNRYPKNYCDTCPAKTYNPSYGQTACKSCSQRDPYMETCDNKTGWSTTCKNGYVVNSFGYCTEKSSYKISANERGQNTGGGVHQ